MSILVFVNVICKKLFEPANISNNSVKLETRTESQFNLSMDYTKLKQLVVELGYFWKAFSSLTWWHWTFQLIIIPRTASRIECLIWLTLLIIELHSPLTTTNRDISFYDGLISRALAGSSFISHWSPTCRTQETQTPLLHWHKR